MEHTHDLNIIVGGHDFAVLPLNPYFRDTSNAAAEALSLQLKMWPHRDTVRFTGVEPTVEPKLAALVAVATKLGYASIILETDATIFAKEAMAARFAHIGLTHVVVRLYGVDAASHDSLAGDGAFDRAVVGIAALKEAGVGVSVRFFMAAANQQQIAEIPDKVSALGVESLILVYPDPYILGPEHAEVLPDADVVLAQLTSLFDAPQNIPVTIKNLPVSLALEVADRPGVEPPSARDIEVALSERIANGAHPHCYLDALCRHCWLRNHCHEAIKTAEQAHEGQQSDTVHMILRSDCPNRCVFCTFRNMDPPGTQYPHTPIEEIDDQMEKGRRLGGKRLVFVGTEPLEYRELPHIIKKARSLGYEDVAIQTHGEDFADFAQVDVFREAGLTEVRIGVYGPTAAVHDAVTQVAGSFDRVMNAIENLKRSPITVKVHTTICRQNADHLLAMEQLLKKRGTRIDEYKLVAPFTRSLDRFREVVPRYSDLLQSIAIQWKTLGLLQRRMGETMLLRISNNIIPPCVLQRAGETAGVTFPVRRDRSQGSAMAGYDKLQIGIKHLNSDGSLNERFLTHSKHDIKTAIECPHREQCAAGDICPGIFMDYARAYGMSEFQPLSQDEFHE